MSMTGTATRRSGTPTRTTRLDIQGLRAIAVGLVLVYHLVPGSLPGGYIGVDMFFVISGFLITGHLIREAEATGRIDLPRFWARRAKRLLPAALLVLVVTLAGVWLFAPLGVRPAFLTQIAASAGYVQNWVLAAQAVDYHAAEAQASPVQHYWSLSVEEQFYFVWPLITVLAIVVARKLQRRITARKVGEVGGAGGAASPANFVKVFAILVIAIAVASLVCSIVMTAYNPASAYFITPTRAWEFAIGGIIACYPLVLGRRVRLAAVWIGLAGIAGSGAFLTSASAFPGWIALVPVVSTALVILAAEPEGKWSPQRVLALRPMQWLGDVSYGVYLWHFPLIILLPYALGSRLGLLGMLTVVAATLVLAHLSKKYVEDPFRTGFSREWSNRRALIVTAAGAAVVLTIPLMSVSPAERQISDERYRVASIVEDPPECFGATALDSESGCEAVPEVTPVPDPAIADKAADRCISSREGDKVRVCEYGADAKTADRSIALIGDSHAEQWLTPLKRIAEEENWQLIVMAKASCPFTAAERDFISMGESRNEELREDCANWNKGVLDVLTDRPEIDTIITSAKSSNRVVAEGDEDWRDAAADGYEKRWNEIPDSVERIIAVEDTPELSSDVIDCVTFEGNAAGTECALPEEDALGPDPLAEAAERSDRADIISLRDYFVVDGESPPVIGGVLVYRDSHHVSWAYADMLADPLAKALQEVLAGNE